MHGRKCSLLGVITVTIAIVAVLLYDKGKCQRKVPHSSGVQMLAIYF